MLTPRDVPCILLLAMSVALVAGDSNLKIGKSEVGISAQAGVMQFRRHKDNMLNDTEETSPVHIRVAQMVQINKQGKEVTNCQTPGQERRRRSSGNGQDNDQQGSSSAAKGQDNDQKGSSSSGNGQDDNQQGSSGNGRDNDQKGSTSSGTGRDNDQQGSSSSANGRDNDQQGSPSPDKGQDNDQKGSSSSGNGRDNDQEGSSSGKERDNDQHGSSGNGRDSDIKGSSSRNGSMNGNARREDDDYNDHRGAGRSGSKSHNDTMKKGTKRFSDLDKKIFRIGEKKDKMHLPSGASLKALVTRLDIDLGDDVGKLAIDLALAAERGSVEIAGEKQELRAGDMKFNIELSEWSWCGEEGNDGAAAFLDVYVEVNSTRPPTMRRHRTASTTASFDLGDNMTMSFSGKFQKDYDNWSDVPDGFPKVDINDPTRIIVRFPRFNSSLLYDPVVSAESEGDEDAEAFVSDASGIKMSAILITMATAVTYAMLN